MPASVQVGDVGPVLVEAHREREVTGDRRRGQRHDAVVDVAAEPRGHEQQLGAVGSGVASRPPRASDATSATSGSLDRSAVSSRSRSPAGAPQRSSASGQPAAVQR